MKKEKLGDMEFDPEAIELFSKKPEIQQELEAAEEDVDVNKNIVDSEINIESDEGIITDPENPDKYKLFPKDCPKKIEETPEDNNKEESPVVEDNKFPRQVRVRRSDYWSNGAIFPQLNYKLDPPEVISPRYYQNLPEEIEEEEEDSKNPFIIEKQENPPSNVEEINLSLMNPDMTPKKPKNHCKETTFIIKVPEPVKVKLLPPPPPPPSEWQKKIQITKDLIKEMKQFCSSTLDILEYDRNGKCYSRSMNYLKSGYKYLTFEHLNYDKAIVEFTMSVVNSIPGSEELYHAYAARSSALFEVGLVTDAILDIERALSISSFKNKKAELYRIRAIYMKNLYPLDDPKIARAFEKAREYIMYMDNDKEKRDMINKIERQEKELICKKTIFNKQNYKKFTPKVEKINTRLPGLSKLVNYMFCYQEINDEGDVVGKLIYAEKDIEPGTVIASEKPYAFVVYPEYIFKICDNCAKQTWSSVPCKNCTEVVYCSKECRRIAWHNHHDIECRIIHSLRQIEVHEIFFMALRLVVKAFKEYGYSSLAVYTNLNIIDRDSYGNLFAIIKKLLFF